MPPVEFEPTISAGQRPQTYALDRVATGTGPEIALPNLNACCDQAGLSSGRKRKIWSIIDLSNVYFIPYVFFS